MEACGRLQRRELCYETRDSQCRTWRPDWPYQQQSFTQDNHQLWSEGLWSHIDPMVLLHKSVQNPTGQRHLEPNSNTYSSHHRLRYTGLRAQSWCILKGGQSSCWSSQRLPKIFFTEPYIIFRVKFSSKTLIQTWRNGFTQNTLRDAAKHLHLEYDSDYHQVSGKVVSGSHLYFDNANVIPLIQALWLSQHLAITT